MVRPRTTFDNIYAKESVATSLRHFAILIFDYLGFYEIEEHHSANYWGEQYFVAHNGDLWLCIAANDEKGFGDYRYWISLKGPESVDDAERAIIGDELARRLTLAGYEVARPYSIDDWMFAKPTVKRVVYRKTSIAGSLDQHVETTVEEIRVEP